MLIHHLLDKKGCLDFLESHKNYHLFIKFLGVKPKTLHSCRFGDYVENPDGIKDKIRESENDWAVAHWSGFPKLKEIIEVRELQKL